MENLYQNDNETQEEENQVDEYVFENVNPLRNDKEIFELFKCDVMDEDDLYQLILRNDIALNLYKSLIKLNRGNKSHNLLQTPCQIKIDLKHKMMVIYFTVSHYFLRIKAELMLIKENNENIDYNKNNNLNNSQSTISRNTNSDKDLVLTLDLSDLFNMFDKVLLDNKFEPISLIISKDVTTITGKRILVNMEEQLYSGTEKIIYLKNNDVFLYSLNEQTKNKQINKKEEQSIFQNDEEDFLEKKFLADEKFAKYLIEGKNLTNLYCFMRGLTNYYETFSTDFNLHNVGISLNDEKGLFYCLDMDNIQDTKHIEEVAKNIQQMLKIDIRCLKNHSLTYFKYGFNSFYRTKFMAKFINSFYNKDDKRLLIKVSPKGKMILSFSFSDPKYETGDNVDNDNTNELDGGEEQERNKKIKDGLLDDEGNGNIVEMITYPVIFDLCKE
jgi:hypothetical protein